MAAEGKHFNNERRTDHHLDALIATQRDRRTAAARRQDLHVCPQCSADFVYPLDWAQAGEEHWTVDLRCPECEWQGSGVFEQEILDRFDVELDAGTAAVINDLNDLTRANMEDEVERFVAALRVDLILPEDF